MKTTTTDTKGGLNKSNKNDEDTYSSTSSSTATTSSSLNLLKPHGSDDAHIGTLYAMRHSPLSTVVKIVLNLSARTAHYVGYIPILSTFNMYFRLLWHGVLPPSKLTVPIMKTSTSSSQTQTTSLTLKERISSSPSSFSDSSTRKLTNNTTYDHEQQENEKSNFIFDSFTIAHYIDHNRHSSTPSLFPNAYLSSIRQFNDYAQTLTSYMRHNLLLRLRSDLHSAQLMFAPRFLRNKPWLVRPILFISLRLMAWKYSSESKAATFEQTRQALLAIRAALAAHRGHDLKYLVGGRLTYADIVIAQAISFDTERYHRFGNLYADPQLSEEFADVVAWGRAVRETHCVSASPTAKKN